MKKSIICICAAISACAVTYQPPASAPVSVTAQTTQSKAAGRVGVVAGSDRKT